MRREIRDMSGFSHSPEAVEMLDHVFLTAKQAATFYEELRQNGCVVLYGVSGHFFLRGNEVCYSPNGHTLTGEKEGHTCNTIHIGTATAKSNSDKTIRTIRCSNFGCKYEIEVENVGGEAKPQKIRCPGCGRKLVLPLGTVLLQREAGKD